MSRGNVSCRASMNRSPAHVRRESASVGASSTGLFLGAPALPLTSHGLLPAAGYGTFDSEACATRPPDRPPFPLRSCDERGGSRGGCPPARSHQGRGVLRINAELERTIATRRRLDERDDLTRPVKIRTAGRGAGCRFAYHLAVRSTPRRGRRADVPHAVSSI